MPAARCLISSLTLQHSWLCCFFLAFPALDISRTFLAHTGVSRISRSTLTQACCSNGHKGVSCAHDSYLCHSLHPPAPPSARMRRAAKKHFAVGSWPQTQKCRPGFPERHSHKRLRDAHVTLRLRQTQLRASRSFHRSPSRPGRPAGRRVRSGHDGSCAGAEPRPAFPRLRC